MKNINNAETYAELYSKVETVGDWMDLLNREDLNYFDFTTSLSEYVPGNAAFWKIAEIGGDWTFNENKLPKPKYHAKDTVNDNMVVSERQILEKTNYSYGYNRHDLDDVCSRIVDALSLENISANVNIQPPGSVKNLHMDTLTCFYHHSEQDMNKFKFDRKQRQPVDYPRMYRMLVALTDWQPGWMVQMGVEHWANWKKGDVILLDWHNVAHATANGSFVNRPLLKITASAKNDWLKDHLLTETVKQINI